MEYEDIIRKVQWLDDQDRKNKMELSELSSRLTGLNANIGALTKQLKSIDQQVSDLSVAAARITQFDQILTRHRTDVAKSIETLDRNAVRREQDATKAHQAEFEEFRKTIIELRGAAAADQASRKERAHEEQRRATTLQDMGTAIEALVRQNKEILEGHTRLEENHRQDAKRLADIQAEVGSIRKRADEAREKSTVNADGIRNVENRINELLESEAGRQEKHAALLQQQALQQVDRDRAWKEWQEKYESFRAQADGASSLVAGFEDSIRAAKQAQEAYDGLNQKLERRLAEIGEIQRLSDERVRQEWIAFKADEQKRWTGHTLAQDESIRELRKDVDRIEKRVSAVDDASQMLQDQLQQTTDTTEKQLQELMNISQDWLSAYERIMGHSKTKAKKAVR